ncbi:MAG: AI-2E family transporter [Chloroflexota bacterium]
MTEAKITQSEDQSPAWGTTTKLVVALTIVALLGILVNQIQPILPPLILSVILSYLLYPFIEMLSTRTKLSWRGSVNLVFILLVLLIIGALTATSVALVNQVDNLVTLVNNFLTDLPAMFDELATNGLVLAVPLFNYEIDLAEYILGLNIDPLGLSEQLLSAVQPVLGQAGGLITSVATSAANVVTWMFFVFVIAYLGLGEAHQGRSFFKELKTSSMRYDISRMGRELSRIYNTFLRGQVLIALMVGITSFLLMVILGVRNALLLGLLAGLAKFVPYLGPLIAGIINALVAFFQPETSLFGFDLPPFWYAVIVVVAAIMLDQVYDSLITPRLFGTTLGVYPAAVLVMALVLYGWIGILGLLLAAPVLASGQLVARYVMLKLLNQYPWPDEEQEDVAFGRMIVNLFSSVWVKLTGLYSRIKLPKIKRKTKEKQDE